MIKETHKKILIILILITFSIFSCDDGMSILFEDIDEQVPVSSPSIELESGIYKTDQNVIISCATEKVNIYYTTDGSDPDENSSLYTAPIPVAGHGTKMNIKAMSIFDGTIKSSTVSEAYTIINGTQTVDSTGKVGQYSSIVVDGLNIYISYYDDTPNFDLKFIKSTDGGATWETPRVVDSTDNVGMYTSMAVDGSNIYISYYDITSSNLKFAKSTDGGNTWPVSKIKTVDSAGDVGKYSSLAVNGQKIYIAYYSDNPNNDLKFARSDDLGENWPAPQIKTVDATGTTGLCLSIAVNGSEVYISYYSLSLNDLWFSKSSDDGDNWPSNQQLDFSNSVGVDTSITTDGTNVYISYFDQTIPGLKVIKSNDHGNNGSWQTPVVVDTGTNTGLKSSIAVSGSYVYVSYYKLGTFFDLKFARSDDGGSSWDLTTVDSPGTVGDLTSLTVEGSNLFISYYDYDNGDLKLAFSMDGGITW